MASRLAPSVWEEPVPPQMLSAPLYKQWQGRSAKHHERLATPACRIDLRQYGREVVELKRLAACHQQSRRFQRMQDAASAQRGNALLADRLCGVARRSDRRQMQVLSARPAGGPSLNFAVRRRQHDAINAENSVFIRRLESVRSLVPSAAQLAQNHTEHAVLSARLSRVRRHPHGHGASFLPKVQQLRRERFAEHGCGGEYFQQVTAAPHVDPTLEVVHHSPDAKDLSRDLGHKRELQSACVLLTPTSGVEPAQSAREARELPTDTGAEEDQACDRLDGGLHVPSHSSQATAGCLVGLSPVHTTSERLGLESVVTPNAGSQTSEQHTRPYQVSTPRSDLDASDMGVARPAQGICDAAKEVDSQAPVRQHRSTRSASSAGSDGSTDQNSDTSPRESLASVHSEDSSASESIPPIVDRTIVAGSGSAGAQSTPCVGDASGSFALAAAESPESEVYSDDAEDACSSSSDGD